MRFLTRLSLATLLLLGPAAGVAHAVTIPQLLALMHEGLSDDVLVALIETDGSTFQLTAADILSLHREGLSDKVILAMQKTAPSRKAPKPVEPEAPKPEAPNREAPVAPTEAPAVQQQIVQPAPSVVNVYQTVTQRVEPAYGYGAMGQFIAVPIAVPIVARPSAVRPARPVYWGWGGQRRPDSWQDAPQRTDQKADAGKKSGGL